MSYRSGNARGRRHDEIVQDTVNLIGGTDTAGVSVLEYDGNRVDRAPTSRAASVAAELVLKRGRALPPGTTERLGIVCRCWERCLREDGLIFLAR